jgi:hypothetical protein
MKMLALVTPLGDLDLSFEPSGTAAPNAASTPVRAGHGLGARR